MAEMVNDLAAAENDLNKVKKVTEPVKKVLKTLLEKIKDEAKWAEFVKSLAKDYDVKDGMSILDDNHLIFYSTKTEAGIKDMENLIKLSKTPYYTFYDKASNEYLVGVSMVHADKLNSLLFANLKINLNNVNIDVSKESVTEFTAPGGYYMLAGKELSNSGIPYKVKYDKDFNNSILVVPEKYSIQAAQIISNVQRNIEKSNIHDYIPVNRINPDKEYISVPMNESEMREFTLACQGSGIEYSYQKNGNRYNVLYREELQNTVSPALFMAKIKANGIDGPRLDECVHSVQQFAEQYKNAIGNENKVINIVDTETNRGFYVDRSGIRDIDSGKLLVKRTEDKNEFYNQFQNHVMSMRSPEKVKVSRDGKNRETNVLVEDLPIKEEIAASKRGALSDVANAQILEGQLACLMVSASGQTPAMHNLVSAVQSVRNVANSVEEGFKNMDIDSQKQLCERYNIPMSELDNLAEYVDTINSFSKEEKTALAAESFLPDNMDEKDLDITESVMDGNDILNAFEEQIETDESVISLGGFAD